MSPEEAVEMTISLVGNAEGDSDDKLVARLVAAGTDQDLARRLLVLVPLAFSRAHYDKVPMIKEYAEEFIVHDQSTGSRTSLVLAADPWFCAAANAAANTSDVNQLLIVAKRSLEYQAINNVLVGLPEGTVPRRIGTSTPIVVCGESRPRPWWKFWADS